MYFDVNTEASFPQNGYRVVLPGETDHLEQHPSHVRTCAHNLRSDLYKHVVMAGLKFVAVVMLLMVVSVDGQNPYFQNNPALANDPLNPNADTNIFYFDSNSDCNGPTRELYGFGATIRGNDLSSSGRLGPASCTISLRSESQFDGTILDIEVRAMNILDCGTQVTIYDGEGAQQMLNSFDCRSSNNQNRRRYQTSGNTATFIMNRQNENSVNFDIEIKIDPIRGGLDPGEENNYGSDFFFDKFDQNVIVGLIGGFYLLVLVICTAVVIYLYRRYQGLNKDWETHQLSTLRTGTAFDARSQMTQPSKVWSMEMQNKPASQYSHGYKDPHLRKTGSVDGDSGVFYNEDSFQKRRLMNEEKERTRSRFASNNTSYIEPEDDPDHFEEKVITSRVRTGQHKNRRPPSYAEAISDHPSDNSSDENESEASSSSGSVRKRPLSSDEERSERSRSTRSGRSRSSRSGTPSETESEEESESDTSSRRNRGARAHRRKPKRKSRHRRSRDESGPSRQAQQQPPPAPPPVPYGAYPQGQFVPLMTGPPQFQPVPMVPGFPPPQYHDQQSMQPPPPSRPEVQPTEPPVYSYLVRRGYTPLDANSNVSTSSAGSHRVGRDLADEPDMRLESGVEYMRR